MQDLVCELQVIVSDDFEDRSIDLMQDWSARGIGIQGVEAILTFIETHPQVEIGRPGALAHFAERFYRQGYEAKLVESIERRPTAHSAWMLNRIINGTQDPAARAPYLAVMRHAETHPDLDAPTRDELAHFRALHERSGPASLLGDRGRPK